MQHPEKYAVLEKKNNKILSIVEKPQNPKTNLAIPEFIFLIKMFFIIVKNLFKSKRGEFHCGFIKNIYRKKICSI